jgi:uncharacterized membrane protein
MAPDQHTTGSGLDRTFRISISLKGLDGLLEIVGGLILLFVLRAVEAEAPDLRLQNWRTALA